MVDMLLLLGVALGINLAMFLVAFKLQTDKLTDISYAVTFIVLSLTALLLGEPDAAKIIGVAMVCTWAVRLGGFLLYRVSKVGKDSRFDEIRGNFKKFLWFWISQGFSVWVILLPILLLAASKHTAFSALSILGLLIWAGGLALEAVADFQKFWFSSDPQNKGKWIDEGVWSVSRHPNYFGEIAVWVGVYLFAVSGLETWQVVVAIASPLFITSLLLFVSGIPKLEKSADERWGDKAAYREYKRRTSLLVPSFKKPAKN